MKSSMRVVLGYLKCSLDDREQFLARLAMTFSDIALGLVKGPIKAKLAQFKASLGNIDGKDSDMERATRDAWDDLKKVVPNSPKSKWYKDVDEARSFFLVKAFVDGFRTLQVRMGRQLSGLDGLWDVTKEVRTLFMDANEDSFDRAVGRFESVDTPKVGDPERGPQTEEKKKPQTGKPERALPVDPGIKKDLSGVGDLLRKTKELVPSTQERVRDHVDGLMDILTAPVRTGSIGGAVRIIRDFIKQQSPRDSLGES